MAKFIKVTEAGAQGRSVVINIDTIEYMLSRPNNGGTELVSITHHTKYVVRESMDDILSKLDDIGMLISIAEETSPIMEVKNDETKLETRA